MIAIDSDEWVADFKNMTCRNNNTRIIVEFHKNGTTYTGKIKDMPFELMRQWAKTEHGNNLLIMQL